MQRYFKYFKIPFIITAVIALICIIIVASSGSDENAGRTNNESLISNNVFNYSGALTDSQVSELEAYITQIEDEIHCDIAVVLLNESLQGYYNTSPEYWVREYANEFADYNEMGYDRARGANIVFVDNIYREPSTGKVYSWISTSGLAKERMSTSDCEAIMDDALYDLTDYSESEDYMKAYKRVVELLPRYMATQAASLGILAKPIYIVAFALVVAGIYILVNWKSGIGVRTTTSTTYVVNGHPNMVRRQDLFLRKSVSKRKIETSNSSGGGGGHGGGGHSR